MNKKAKKALAYAVIESLGGCTSEIGNASSVHDQPFVDDGEGEVVVDIGQDSSQDVEMDDHSSDCSEDLASGQELNENAQMTEAVEPLAEPCQPSSSSSTHKRKSTEDDQCPAWQDCTFAAGYEKSVPLVSFSKLVFVDKIEELFRDRIGTPRTTTDADGKVKKNPLKKEDQEMIDLLYFWSPIKILQHFWQVHSDSKYCEPGKLGQFLGFLDTHFRNLPGSFLEKVEAFTQLDQLVLQELAFHVESKEPLEIFKIRGLVDKFLGEEATFARKIKSLYINHQVKEEVCHQIMESRAELYKLVPEWLLETNEGRQRLKTKLVFYDIIRLWHKNNSTKFAHLLFPTPNHHSRFCMFTLTMTAHLWCRFLAKDQRTNERVENILREGFPKAGKTFII